MVLRQLSTRTVYPDNPDSPGDISKRVFTPGGQHPYYVKGFVRLTKSPGQDPDSVVRDRTWTDGLTACPGPGPYGLSLVPTAWY